MGDLKMLQPQKVQNIINRFCYTIGMLPTSYKLSLTYEEQLLTIGKYLEDTVIPALNNNAEAVQELQNLFLDLQNYVNNYFDDLNLQTEINNKLDEMLQDGTLANIINQDIFNELNEKVNNTELQTEKNTEILKNFTNYFFGIFFHRDTLKMNYFTSLDGINWAKQNIETNLPEGRDPNIIYVPNFKKFIMSYSSASNERTFILGISDDLKNWTYKSIYISGYDSSRKCWAPNLFYENNTLYVSFTVKNINDDNTQIYLTSTNDLINFNEWTPPQKLALGLDYVIDSNIIKVNDLYYLMCKNGTNENVVNPIQLFTSNDLINWTLLKENCINANAEGCNIVPFNDKFLLNVDLFYERGQAFCKTENLENTTNWIESNNLQDFAHGDILYVDNDEINNVIKKLKINFSGTQEDVQNLNSANISGVIENFVILPGYVYTITGNPTITNLLNPFNVKQVSMKFATNVTNHLKIVNMGNNLQNMKKVDLDFRNSAGVNSQTFLLDTQWDYDSSTLPIAKEINVLEFSSNPNNIQITEANLKIHGTFGLLIIALKATANVSNQWTQLLSLPANLYRPIQGGMITGDRKNVYQMNGNNVFGSITLSSGQTEVVRLPILF